MPSTAKKIADYMLSRFQEIGDPHPVTRTA